MNPAAQCRHIFRTYGKLAEGLDDSHRGNQPTPEGKTAGWLVGHLAVTGDFARKLCGARPLCPADWRAKFNPGTKPSTNEADYPPMAELLARLRDVYADLPASYESARASQAPGLAGPNPFEPARA